MSSIFKLKRRGQEKWVYQTELDNGKRTRITLKAKTKKEAMMLQTKLDLKFEYSSSQNFMKKYTWDNIFDLYIEDRSPFIKEITQYRYQIEKNNIMEFFNITNIKYITDLKVTSLNQYIKYRQDTGSTNRTINEEIRFIKATLKFAWENEYIENIHIRKWPSKLKEIPKHPERKGYYTDEEIYKLKTYFKENDPEYYKIFCTSLYTGARISEVLSLKKQDIDFDKKMMRLRQKKTERSSNVYNYYPIHNNLIEIFKEQFFKCETLMFEDVLYHDSGYWTKKLKKVCEKLNIPYKKYHGLRDTFTNALLNNNVNVTKVKDALGHSNISTTMKYTHTTVSHEDINKINF